MAFVPVPLLVAALLLVSATRLWDYVFVRLVWRPYAITKGFREQGIHGPSYRFFKGCNEEIRSMKEKTDGLVLDVGDHKYLPRIAPHYLEWRAQYGEPFLYWYGAQARICIFDYELARQILSSKSGHFVKNDAHPTLLALVGKGLGFMEGADWVRHRRVINPAFTIDKLKIVTKTMLDFADTMAGELEAEASRNENGETQVDIYKHFSDLTVDNIAYAIFGSSYRLGKQVFQAQTELLGITMATFLDVPIPGSKWARSLTCWTRPHFSLLFPKLKSSSTHARSQAQHARSLAAAGRINPLHHALPRVAQFSGVRGSTALRRARRRLSLRGAGGGSPASAAQAAGLPARRGKADLGRRGELPHRRCSHGVRWLRRTAGACGSSCCSSGRPNDPRSSSPSIFSEPARTSDHTPPVAAQPRPPARRRSASPALLARRARALTYGGIWVRGRRRVLLLLLPRLAWRAAP